MVLREVWVFPVTFHEFYDAVGSMLRESDLESGRSLEDYLRTLWRLLQDDRTEAATYERLTALLRESFLSDPAPFDERWLAYTDPPDNDEAHDDFDYLRQTLVFQIADLRRMTGGQLQDPNRGLGVQSPTGNDWYNFEPVQYLECATQGFSDNLGAGNLTQHEHTCTWRTLAILLEMGRLYE
jgi:hypothetical protein